MFETPFRRSHKGGQKWMILSVPRAEQTPALGLRLVGTYLLGKRAGWM